MPQPGEIFDNYRLIRRIGAGGFGEVWLCRSEVLGDRHALKFVAGARPEILQKEFAALMHYRRVAAQLRSPYLMPVEHVGRNDGGLFYVMPLADGIAGDSENDSEEILPENDAWAPRTLAGEIEKRRTREKWFSPAEIVEIFVPILRALQALSDAGLVHRDVKPENILFLGGRSCLADISLLAGDAAQVTRRGTPGYVTPSWYLGGHADMYGAAATLFALLTGNEPDQLGRSAFRFPPQGEASLLPAERDANRQMHRLILRAAAEKPGERFLNFENFADALQRVLPAEAAAGAKAKTAGARRFFPALAACVAGVALFAGIGLFFAGKPESTPGKISPEKQPAAPEFATIPVLPVPATSAGSLSPPASATNPVEEVSPEKEVFHATTPEKPAESSLVQFPEKLLAKNEFFLPLNDEKQFAFVINRKSAIALLGDNAASVQVVFGDKRDSVVEGLIVRGTSIADAVCIIFPNWDNSFRWNKISEWVRGSFSPGSIVFGKVISPNKILLENNEFSKNSLIESLKKARRVTGQEDLLAEKGYEDLIKTVETTAEQLKKSLNERRDAEAAMLKQYETEYEPRIIEQVNKTPKPHSSRLCYLRMTEAKLALAKELAEKHPWTTDDLMSAANGIATYCLIEGESRPRNMNEKAFFKEKILPRLRLKFDPPEDPFRNKEFCSRPETIQRTIESIRRDVERDEAYIRNALKTR